MQKWLIHGDPDFHQDDILRGFIHSSVVSQLIKIMLILSMETSCDETSAAILEADESLNKFGLLSSVVSSQAKLHSAWGGVVPNLAAREHLKNIFPVLEQTIKEAGVKMQEVGLLCVTQGPGLIPALLVGANAAKTLSYFHQKPLLGIHHIEGHIYANFFENKKQGRLDKHSFPILNLVVSGGHTQLILMKDHLDYEIVGETMDDAAGEAFDKVAKILELGYPGGPIVSQKAGEAEKITREDMASLEFPRPMLKSKDLNFSFSGLKTAVLYFYKDLERRNLSKKDLEDWKKIICQKFQEAVIDVLIQKTLKGISEFRPKTVLLSGGVAANFSLKKELGEAIKKDRLQVKFSYPEMDFCGDNAAMIGAAGLARYGKLKEEGVLKKLEGNWRDLEAEANLKLF
ncbi:MAG: tRNA (adenosine(37)-N6)-threonylcarbamoyltransferase complex transferase subunit TsaD [Candidatus Moranbacteria bacterium]|nr:tRNA (adenosine(37)-N6)-threonylcarbamoyltransferase complex transferase subunit TsaD [Candidatus Moranbacteria bacterium]